MIPNFETDYPTSYENYQEWKDQSPIPAGTVYEDIQLYIGDQEVLSFEGDRLSFEDLNTDSDEITVFANGELVWLKVAGQIVLDRTIDNPLAV